MAMAELADFVQIYDIKQNYNIIDFSGEMAGMSISPETKANFIGVAQQMYGNTLKIKYAA